MVAGRNRNGERMLGVLNTLNQNKGKGIESMGD